MALMSTTLKVTLGLLRSASRSRSRATIAASGKDSRPASEGRNAVSGGSRRPCEILNENRGSTTLIEVKEYFIMDPFASPSSSLPGTQPSNEHMMDQLKQQLAQAYAEEFFSTVRDKCFTKCVTKPSTSLSGSESSCVSRCVERYIEATGIVSRAVFTALPR